MTSDLALGHVSRGLGDGGAGVGEPADHVGGQLGTAGSSGGYVGSYCDKYHILSPTPSLSNNLIVKLGAERVQSTGQYIALTMTATSTVSLLCLLVLELELDVIASLCLSFSFRLLLVFFILGFRVYIRVYSIFTLTLQSIDVKIDEL